MAMAELPSTKKSAPFIRRTNPIIRKTIAFKISVIIKPLYNTNIPRCSRRIFSHIRIRIIPPTISAFFLYLVPKKLPMYTPIMDITKVVIPIIAAADAMG